MTDKPAADDKAADGKTPPVKSGVKEDTPHDSAADPKPQPPKEDPYGEARLLRAQADAIESAAAARDDTHVRLKVEPPHQSFSYGGVDVGSDWTPVHATLAQAVLRAAAETPGVTVTQEGQ